MSNLSYNPTRYSEATKKVGSAPAAICQSEIGTRRRYELMETLLLRAGWDPMNNDNIIDIACGYAGLYMYLHEKYPDWNNYTGVEACEELLIEAGKNAGDDKVFALDIQNIYSTMNAYRISGSYGVMIGCFVDCTDFKMMRRLMEAGMMMSKKALCFSSVANIEPFRGDAGLLPSPTDMCGIAYSLSNHFEIIAGEYVKQDVAGIIYK